MPSVTFNEVIPGVHYGCHPDHRNGNHNKSQWTISTTEEVESFKCSYSQRWVLGTRAWGLHLVDGQPAYLGTAIDRSRHLFVARFEDGNGNQRWQHGYPADHQGEKGGEKGTGCVGRSRRKVANERVVQGKT